MMRASLACIALVVHGRSPPTRQQFALLVRHQPKPLNTCKCVTERAPKAAH